MDVYSTSIIFCIIISFLAWVLHFHLSSNLSLTYKFQAIVGYIADRAESRRWPMIVGLVALAAATALLCVGTNIGLWIAGRLFQGAAAAVVWTVGLALMVDTVGKDGLGQAIGYVSMSLSLGTMAGPLLGGVLYQDGGYYSVFGLAFGLIAIDVVLRLALIEKRHALPWIKQEKTEDRSVDQQDDEKKGSSSDSEPSDTPSAPISSTPETPTMIKKTPGPLDRVKILLKSYRLVVAVWGYFVMSLVMTSFDSVLPIFVEETFGWQQTAQGLIFLPFMIPHFLDPITGFIIDRFPKSPRYIVAAGFFASVPIAVLLRLITENTMHDKILLCALLALLGLCLAVVMTPLVVEVTKAVEQIETESPDIFGRGGAMALAFGLSNMGFALGSLIGPFFAGFIRQSAGWGTMGWAMGLITGVTAIPCLLLIGGWILNSSDSRPSEDVDQSHLE